MVDAYGVKGRRRTWLAARSGGELLASVEPPMSEWGNPARVMPGDSPREEGQRPVGELKHLSTRRKRHQPRFPK